MAVMTLVECGRNNEAESTLSCNIEHGRLQRTFVFGVGAAAVQGPTFGNIGGIPAGFAVASIPTGGIFRAPGAQDLLDTINAIIGNTASTVQPDGSGSPGVYAGLNRTLPMSDPQISYWFAQSIDKLQGVGQPTLVKAAVSIETDYLVPSLAYGFLLYETYYVTVTFAPVAYAVFANQYVTFGSTTWWLPQLVNGAAVQGLVPYASEEQRFCTYDEEAVNDYVVSNTGNMVFREVGGLNNIPFSGPPRIYLPNSTVTFKWYQVPWRYISSPNSFIRKYRGYVNQFPFWLSPTPNDDGSPAYVFQPGSLLYLTYKYTPYNPPITPSSAWVPTIPSGAIPAKLVNIELSCLYTSRTVSGTPVQPFNPNWIAAGHALLPSFVDRGFHYATAVATQNDPISKSAWVPSYLSFVFQQLFSDPDFDGFDD